ncbi:hypothetical protein C3709_08525 [Lelliottia aquatilis]|uniref:DUF1482 family protein n=1 Tax=Lelliottia aquatilis TaxID=2080838 RepID=A0ABX5A2S9_9ENTR|nr:hypothetical protein C3Z09_20120 [Lelliottia aquatilis]POZ27611.1 hypothetical protein C3708_08530 [Lelliottia sp. 7254-16]POZ23987.1 hypothetical protein C3712_07125 [Lelliottia aquatilis]POZ29880.1 hypothetical protein C3711_01740 [Lelliottia aquatilis]POZ35445.1 hypothetical protein C3710_01740 [Lelliottia aquatilis]
MRHLKKNRLTFALLMWALVFHAIVNGHQQDTILDVYESASKCNSVNKTRHINGECYEVAEIIHHSKT